MSAKIKNFIYTISQGIVSTIKKPLTALKLMHDKLKQTDENTGTVPYLEFYEWAVDTLIYGLLITIVYIDLFILQGWMKWALLPFCLGVTRWLWLDFVENTSKSVRGKK